MENTTVLDGVLWLLVGVVACSMAAVLVIGWYKGMNWEKDLKKRQR